MGEVYSLDLFEKEEVPDHLFKMELECPVFEGDDHTVVARVEDSTAIENPTREQIDGGEYWICPNCRWSQLGPYVYECLECGEIID